MSDRNQTLRTAANHLKADRFANAADLCRSMLAAHQDDTDARFLLGLAVGALGEIAPAIDHLRKVARARPDHPDVHRELARLLQSVGKRMEAETAFREALRVSPKDAATLCAFGRFLLEQGRADEAAQRAEAALAIRPNFSPAHNLLGVALADLGRMDEAVEQLRRAIASDPANASALANLGTALAAVGRFDESLAASTEALNLTPGDVTIHLNRAMALLKSGRLREGWSEYEWRHRKPGREKLPPHLMLLKLAYLGDIIDRRILVHHEEGFGDTIQFLRYIPMLARVGAKVMVWMPEELARLVRFIPGIVQLFSGNVQLPIFDYHCPIISLPRVFDTVLETIPAAIPYIHPDPALSRSWAARLPPSPGRRIGLVWSGEPRPYDLAALALDRRRSLPLASLAPLAEVSNIGWISLQKGDRASDAATPPAGMAIHDPMHEVRDFADTAAIVANLDLVISVDTSVAHLAGAMGKPVFLLDRADNCWRWLSGRNDSPWYPSLRIFRQHRAGDWEPVIQEVTAALAQFGTG